MRLRLAIAGIAVVAIAATLTPLAPAASSHVFKATYTGNGSGGVAGQSASGRGTATGRGNVIGRSTLSGSGAGTLTSISCLSFNGKAALKGSAGTIKLVTHGAQACVPTTGGTVSFSGHARVTGGTSRFAGAGGTLKFHGVYDGATSKVTISFKGRVSY